MVDRGMHGAADIFPFDKSGVLGETRVGGEEHGFVITGMDKKETGEPKQTSQEISPENMGIVFFKLLIGKKPGQPVGRGCPYGHARYETTGGLQIADFAMADAGGHLKDQMKTMPRTYFETMKQKIHEMGPE